MSDNTEIKLKDFFNILWSRKYKIIGVGIVSSILFVIYSFSIPPVYTSSALIKVSDSQETGASLNSGLTGLASLAGINLRGGGGNKIEANVFIIDGNKEELSRFEVSGSYNFGGYTGFFDTEAEVVKRFTEEVIDLIN